MYGGRLLVVGVAAPCVVLGGAILAITCSRQLDTADGVAASRALSEGNREATADGGDDVTTVGSRDADLSDSKALQHVADGPPMLDGGDAEIDGDVDEDGDSPEAFVIVRRWDKKQFELTPATREGGFGEDDHELAKEAWARYKTGQTHAIHPRLLEIIFKAAQHFKAPHVVVTSGYRPMSRSSLHHWGRAADIQLPDVPCMTLAKHLRSYGFVGVGAYPRTGGVHLDIRRESYFWVSWAPPGKRWRERGILFDLAKKMDREAIERGVEPPEPLPESGQKAREAKSWRNRKAAKRRRAKATKRRRAKATKRRPTKATKRRPTKAAKRRPSKTTKRQPSKTNKREP